MSAERGSSVATSAWGQHCRDTALLLQKLHSVLAPCRVVHVCTPPGTGAGWGSLCHAPLHTKATALDASSLNWLNFREKFAPLIKTCFTEHWVWPQKDTQAACFRVPGLQIQSFPLWKKSFEMACCSFQTVLVMGSRQHATQRSQGLLRQRKNKVVLLCRTYKETFTQHLPLMQQRH